MYLCKTCIYLFIFIEHKQVPRQIEGFQKGGSDSGAVFDLLVR